MYRAPSVVVRDHLDVVPVEHGRLQGVQNLQVGKSPQQLSDAVWATLYDEGFDFTITTFTHSRALWVKEDCRTTV